MKKIIANQQENKYQLLVKSIKQNKMNLFSDYKWIKKNKIKNSGLPTVMKKIIEFAL